MVSFIYLYFTFIFKYSLFFRSMIWLSSLALFTLRAIPVSLEFNALSGIIGEWMFPFHGMFLFSFWQDNMFIIFFLLSVQLYVNNSCYFCNNYCIVLRVLLQSIFWRPVFWTCYISKLFMVYICSGGKNDVDPGQFCLPLLFLSAIYICPSPLSMIYNNHL